MRSILDNPFRLAFASKFRSPLVRGIVSICCRALEWVLGLTPLAKRYDRLTLRDFDSAEEFAAATLEEFGTSWEIVKGDLERIPKDGPVILVANHPFGCIEGVLLIHLLSKIRNDSRLMANFLLNRIPEFSGALIGVDPFETTASTTRNIRGLSHCIEWLEDGGLLTIFPSGTVSHLTWEKKEVRDPMWNPNAARIAKKTNATVVPVFIHGRNSTLFQLAGLISPWLRTLLLIREFSRSARGHVQLSIGAPIPAKRLNEFETDRDAIEYLRLRTHIMVSAEKNEKAPVSADAGSTQSSFEAIIDPIDPQELAREVDALPQRQCLLQEGSYDIYYAEAAEIPACLREIGRLREVTFRRTNEGTGRSIDLDVFDNIYTHLFMWNREKRQIIGAYRLARADEVLQRYGKKGLYTYTLFKYSTSLLKQLGPALEMGRSFVIEQHQRDFSALARLWQGIARFVAAHPRYTILFGPVSISSDYNAISRQLIIDFLRMNCFTTSLAREVQPRTPIPRFPIRGIGPEQVRVVKKLSDVTELLKEIETEHENVPVLLRQYLRLGAKTIGYNLDPEFSDVHDALLYVDLRKTEPKILQRYMGRERLREYYQLHGIFPDFADRANS